MRTAVGRRTPRQRAARYLGLGLLLLSTLAATAVALLWIALAGSRAKLDGALALHGPEQPVSITRDALGIATVDAADRRDLAWGLGFVHAQERYFDMDLMRRLAAGELAELIGPAAVAMDMDHRRHRFRAHAEQQYADLPEPQRMLIDAYREGVNAGLLHLNSRPFEYLLLGTPPQPWRSEDCLLVAAAMYLDLNHDGNNRRELFIAQMRSALPAAIATLLESGDGRWEAPLQGSVSAPPAVPDAAVLNLRREPSSGSVAQLEEPQPLIGSNSFAVGGTLTDTGAAIVANDMHLALRVPNLWFRAELRYPDVSAEGGVRRLDGLTLPGEPFLIAGSNGHIAWGFTNSYGDWMDWVRIQRDVDHPQRYRVPEGWADIERHEERIHVRGEQPQRLLVEQTRWGPILYRGADGTEYAQAWVAERAEGNNLRIAELEQIDTTAAALALAPHIGIPPQNFIVGDREGHIGWTLTGNAMPLRSGCDAQLPCNWSHAGNGWNGYRAASDYPQLLDPPSARLWTANNRTTSDEWLARIGNGGYDTGARAQQIRDDLAARNHYTPSDMLAIQLDDRALFLTRWHDLLMGTLTLAPSPATADLQRYASQWSGHADVNSVAYRITREFRSEVRNAVFAPFIARVRRQHPVFELPFTGEAALWALVSLRPQHLLDPQYADWNALLNAAALRVAQGLAVLPGGMAARTWGEANTARIQHPLARALPPLLARYLMMPRSPQAGDSHMPRVAAPGFGASERFGIMPGHEDMSYLHMPGGQSDHPLSPYFGAGHQAWLDGTASPLLPGPPQHQLILKPAS